MSSLERLALDHSAQMILLVEAQSLRIVMANRVAVERLGYREEELLAKSILDVESALQDVFYWGRGARRAVAARRFAQEGFTCAPTVRCTRSASRSRWSSRTGSAGCWYRPAKSTRNGASRTCWHVLRRNCARRSNRPAAASW